MSCNKTSPNVVDCKKLCKEYKLSALPYQKGTLYIHIVLYCNLLQDLLIESYYVALMHFHWATALLF